ncbi:MAG: helix-turn-helix transcriptional regulator [Roseiflexus sp.]
MLLRESPAELQRLIARVYRVSLPHGCDADERACRLRRALCSAAAVREVYRSLDAETRAALEDLRTRRGVISDRDLTSRYGSIRSYRQIAGDLQPRSVAERLLLRGWILPRSGSRRAAPGYLLAPELRRWLPRPLQIITHGSAPTTTLPPALLAVRALLLVCAGAPLAVCADGSLRRSALRALAPLLALDLSSTDDLYAFVMPLIYHLGLTTFHQGRCAITIGASAFLSQPVEEQRRRLLMAWIAHPAPDRWLCRLRLSLRGVDRPLLRRRLIQWVEFLPPDRLISVNGLYEALAVAYGPLVDARTHGFRTIRRTPWQPHTAAHAFLTALRKPLCWLGVIGWHDGAIFRPAPLDDAAAGWRYSEPDALVVPFAAVNADALRLSAHGCWIHGDQESLTFRFARRQNRSALSSVPRLTRDECSQLMRRYAGPTPDGWIGLMAEDSANVRVFDGMSLIADDPTIFQQTIRARSVRRHIRMRPAPGIALARREDITLLRRALARRGVDLVGEIPSSPAPDALPGHLNPGDCAALLAACAFYRRYAPTDMPLVIHAELEARLRYALPPVLRQTLDETLERIARGAAVPVRDNDLEESSAPLTMAQDAAIPSTTRAEPLPVLRSALRRRDAVTIDYDTGGIGSIERRTIRPLEIEHRGDSWYVRAYCLLRQAERTFRLDRVLRVVG